MAIELVSVGIDGAVAELADALDLGSSSERSAGSIPVSPTHPGQASLFRDSLDSRNYFYGDFSVVANNF